MRIFRGAVVLLFLTVLGTVLAQGPTQKVNLATDVFGTLPAANLPVFGVTVDNVTGTSYSIACGTTLGTTDNGHLKVFSNAGAIAVSIFKANTCTYAPTFVVAGYSTSGAGTITITPTTSQISKNGGAYGSTATVSAGGSFRLFVDIVSSGCSTNGCWDLLVP
jgi:hypothetical protein